MITFKIIQRTKPLKNGRYSICLRATKDRKTRIITLGISANQDQFENESFTKLYPNYREWNRVLLNTIDRAKGIELELRLKSTDFSVDDFVQAFRSNHSAQMDFYAFGAIVVKEFTEAGKVSTAKAFEDTIVSMRRYTGETLPFEEITPAFIESLVHSYRLRGNEDGGIAFKLRHCRALISKAIQRGVTSKENYPFDVYKLSRLKPKNKKRALDVSELKLLLSLDIEQYPHLNLSYYLFLFSFFSRGMNFKDIMLLKSTDIQNGVVQYYRSKTARLFRFKLLPPAVDIVTRISEHHQFNKEYIFPVMPLGKLNAVQLDNLKRNKLSKVNKDLKQLSEILGFTKPFTFYTARHTYATVMKYQGVSTSIISESMGHQSVSTTETYLKSFGDEILEQENRKLLDI